MKKSKSEKVKKSQLQKGYEEGVTAAVNLFWKLHCDPLNAEWVGEWLGIWEYKRRLVKAWNRRNK